MAVAAAAAAAAAAAVAAAATADKSGDLGRRASARMRVKPPSSSSACVLTPLAGVRVIAPRRGRGASPSWTVRSPGSECAAGTSDSLGGMPAGHSSHSCQASLSSSLRGRDILQGGSSARFARRTPMVLHSSDRSEGRRFLNGDGANWRGQGPRSFSASKDRQFQPSRGVRCMAAGRDPNFQRDEMQRRMEAFRQAMLQDSMTVVPVWQQLLYGLAAATVVSFVLSFSFLAGITLVGGLAVWSGIRALKGAISTDTSRQGGQSGPGMNGYFGGSSSVPRSSAGRSGTLQDNSAGGLMGDLFRGGGMFEGLFGNSEAVYAAGKDALSKSPEAGKLMGARLSASQPTSTSTRSTVDSSGRNLRMTTVSFRVRGDTGLGGTVTATGGTDGTTVMRLEVAVLDTDSGKRVNLLQGWPGQGQAGPSKKEARATAGASTSSSTSSEKSVDLDGRQVRRPGEVVDPEILD